MPKSVKQLQQELKDLDNQFKRALADYQNLQKRQESDRVRMAKFANESLLDKLLPVLDDLERAQAHLNDPGLKLVLDQFKTVLNSEGIEEINTTNQKFDPNTMDCVEVIEGKKDQVISVQSKGYLLNEKVLRPARVTVGKGK